MVSLVMNRVVNPKIILISGYARSGKDTFAESLVQLLPVAHRVSFAYELKEIANKTLWMLGLNHINLHEDSDKVEYRDILIGIARAARKAEPEIFARLACRRIDDIRDAGSHVIVTDWRYANEHEYLCDKYGKDSVMTVMMNRSGNGPAHEEEGVSIKGIIETVNIGLTVEAQDGDLSTIAKHATMMANHIKEFSNNLPESRTLV